MVALAIEPAAAPPRAEACTPPYGPGSAPDCEVSVNCVEDVPEKRSVVRITTTAIEGQTVGSGVLVNNGLGLVGAPYVVTAAHLLDFDHDGIITPDEANEFQLNAEFGFGVEVDCNRENPTPPFVVSGCMVVAENEGFDMVLLLLQTSAEDLMSNAQPYYAGWDILGPMTLPHVHAIHHPCADARMITGGESTEDFNGFILLHGLSCGGLQPGSSGGPLFDTSTRNLLGAFSGTLGGDGGPHQGYGLCAGESTDVVFGRFNDFGLQFLGANDSVPAFDAATMQVEPEPDEPPLGACAQGGPTDPACPPQTSAAITIAWDPDVVIRRNARSSVFFFATNLMDEAVTIEHQVTVGMSGGAETFEVPLLERGIVTYDARDGGAVQADLHLAQALGVLQEGDVEIIVSARLIAPVQTPMMEMARAVVQTKLDDDGLIYDIDYLEQ